MIYFDNNATTRMTPEVIAAMLPVIEGVYGNPSSGHTPGRTAKFAVETARAEVANLIGAGRKDEIVFTATGSEADNWAIFGGAGDVSERPHVITSMVEHGAVGKAFDELESRGCRVSRIEVDERGTLDIDSLRKALNAETRLVSLMLANNETGVIFPIAEIAEIIKERSNALFHVDGVNAVGKIPIDLKGTRVDMFSMSAHKFYGPKGIGALYIRRGVRLPPVTVGGGQEFGLRSGTEAVHQIVGMGAGAHFVQGLDSMTRIGEIRDRLEYEILNKIPNSHLNGTSDTQLRLPNTSSISFAGVNGELLMASLDDAGICVSTGSACHSQAAAASGVLQAMNVPYEQAMGAIRFSLGRYNTDDEVTEVLRLLPEIIAKLRRLA